MTREEALTQYVTNAETIKRLNAEQHNLKKLILGEPLAPSNPKVREPIFSTPRRVRAHNVIETLGQLFHACPNYRATPKELVEASSFAHDTVNDGLRRMVKRGLVQKVSPGVYELAIHSDDANGKAS